MSDDKEMEKGQEEEAPSRYGIAALDQLDDDEPSSSSSSSATTETTAAAATATETKAEKHEKHKKEEAPMRTVDSFTTAVGVIIPPPDLKG